MPAPQDGKGIRRTVNGETREWDGSMWVPVGGGPAAPAAPMITLPPRGPSGRTDMQDLELLKQLLTVGGSVGGALLLGPAGAGILGGGAAGSIAGGAVGGATGRTVGHLPEALMTATTGQPNPGSFITDPAIGAVEGATQEAAPMILNPLLRGGAAVGRGFATMLGDPVVDTAGMSAMDKLKAAAWRHGAAALRGGIVKGLGLPTWLAGAVSEGPVIANTAARGADALADAVGTGTTSEGVRNALGRLIERIEGPAGRPAVVVPTRTPPAGPTPWWEDLDLNPGGSPAAAKPWWQDAPVETPARTRWSVTTEQPYRMGGSPTPTPPAGDVSPPPLFAEPRTVPVQNVPTTAGTGLGRATPTRTLPDGTVIPWSDVPEDTGFLQTPRPQETFSGARKGSIERGSATDLPVNNVPGEPIADYQRRTLREAAGPAIRVQPSSSLDALRQQADPAAAALMKKWGLPMQGDIADAVAQEAATAPAAGTRTAPTDREKYWEAIKRTAGQIDAPRWVGDVGVEIRDALTSLKQKLGQYSPF